MSLMGKVIKNIERPVKLQELLLELRPNENIQIYCTAYKPEIVRVRCSQLNKKFNKKVFVATSKGLVDSTIVTRLQ